MTKIVIGTVSTRKEGSNSRYLAEILIELAMKKGCEVETIDFNEANIKPYVDSRDLGAAAINSEDDFESYLIKVLDADAFVLCAPIYWCSYPSKFQVFIEKFSAAMRKPELNFSERMAGKKWLYIMVSAEAPITYENAFWQIQE